MDLEVVCDGLDQTELLAGAISSKLRGGEVIELVGDVGAGKTTFVKGLVKALGSDEPVSSPTFTISNIYEAGRLPVYHFDFYRLGSDDSLIKHELSETVADKSGVVVLEWADSVRSVLSGDHLRIDIESPSEEIRKFKLHFPPQYSYMGSGE